MKSIPRPRKPLLLTNEEAVYLFIGVSDDLRKLMALKPSSRFGKEQLEVVKSIRNKLWKI